MKSASKTWEDYEVKNSNSNGKICKWIFLITHSMETIDQVRQCCSFVVIHHLTECTNVATFKGNGLGLGEYSYFSSSDYLLQTRMIFWDLNRDIDFSGNFQFLL